MKQIVVSSNEANQRLDKLLLKYMNKAPKSFLYKMLRKKNITLNEKKATGSERLVIGDEIKLFLSDETIEKFSSDTCETVQYDLNIIYEDENILILNKPSDMLSQKADKEDISMVEHVISYLLDNNKLTKEQLKSFKPSVCNRLDRNTSGILIAGKSLIGLQTMGMILKERTIQKYYRCIVKGEIFDKQNIKAYLTKDETENKVTIQLTPFDNSIYIETEYEPLITKNGYTLLSIKLITGRSHQIRAHLSAIGHPIIGDTKYGDYKINNYFKKKHNLRYQLLHSYEIIFPVISGQLDTLSNKKFTADLPDNFKVIIKSILEND